MTMAEHDDLFKSASHVQEGSASEVSDAPPPALLPQPTTGQERVAALDVLRGFAILGILLVNMAVFNSPLFYFLADIQTMAWNARFCSAAIHPVLRRE